MKLSILSIPIFPESIQLIFIIKLWYFVFVAVETVVQHAPSDRYV